MLGEQGHPVFSRMNFAENDNVHRLSFPDNFGINWVSAASKDEET
jgi:hypothetical protein